MQAAPMFIIVGSDVEGYWSINHDDSIISKDKILAYISDSFRLLQHIFFDLFNIVWNGKFREGSSMTAFPIPQ